MRRAFTLIELLIVIVIIGVLASLVTVGLNSIRSKTRDSKRVADIRQWQAALEMYKNDNNVYPTNATSGNALIGPNGQTYIAKIPSAPGKTDGSCATDSYDYSSSGTGANYTINYCLGGAVQSAGPANCIAQSGDICATPPSYTISGDALNPGTIFNSLAPGTRKAWDSNLDNIKVSDNAYATATLSPGCEIYTDYLMANNFGFNIPSSATITGILVQIERKANYAVSGSSVNDYQVSVIKSNGTIGATNKAAWLRWPLTEAYVSFPATEATNDLWGESWTAGDINDVDFGIAFRAELQSVDDCNPVVGSIDNIRIRVYYTN